MRLKDRKGIQQSSFLFRQSTTQYQPKQLSAITSLKEVVRDGKLWMP